MGLSPESYTFMTMYRPQTNNYYFFSKFQVFRQSLRKWGILRPFQPRLRAADERPSILRTRLVPSEFIRRLLSSETAEENKVEQAD